MFTKLKTHTLLIRQCVQMTKIGLQEPRFQEAGNASSKGTLRKVPPSIRANTWFRTLDISGPRS